MKKVMFTAAAAIAMFAMVACNNNKAAEATEDTTCAQMEQCEHKCAHESESNASTETFPTFLGTNMRAHFMISVRTLCCKATDYICAGVIYPNKDKKRQEEPLIQEIEE